MKDKKEAAFIKRLAALVIDLFLIGFISGIISAPFVITDNYEKLSKESKEVTDNYMEGKISPDTYVRKNSNINYDLSRETALVSIITVAIYIVYFIIYQLKNKGQTLGKKLLKIRIISTSEDELNMNQLAIRSIMINSIIANMLVIALVLIGTKEIYFIGTIIVELIQYLIIFVSALMVLSRKDKKGLHDLVAKTKVICEV